jgi:tripartite-type tricarboxylate transporter receptor subunit TctC
MHIAARLIGLAFAAMAATVPLGLPASAQSWPQRTVKFILPLGPGSGLDIGARLFADRLSAIWGKPVVVENRPGSDGIIAISAFVNAQDDHVLLVSSSAVFVAHPYLHDNLPYQPRDLQPLARISETIVAVGVPEALKINTMAELIALARAEPGKVNAASVTGLQDFIFRGFIKKENLDVGRVPYRDAVQALNDLAEGRIQIMMSATAIMRPQVQNGRVKLIALQNRQRSNLVPGIPTVTEAGFPDLTFDGLVGIFGPRDIPADVREKIAADLRAVSADPVIRARMDASGQALIPGSGADMIASMEDQRARASAVAKILGLKSSQ